VLAVLVRPYENVIDVPFSLIDAGRLKLVHAVAR
jgi:hypothetical protein